MKRLRDIWGTASLRWKKAMPSFFKKMMYLFTLIGGTAIAAHVAITSFGITPHDWWLDISPYIIGGSAGVVFACKFTVSGGFRGEKVDHNVFTFDKEHNTED